MSVVRELLNVRDMLSVVTHRGFRYVGVEVKVQH